MSEKKLSAARIIGYGVGDFGFNLFYTGLNLYLLYYYTDILGIPPATAGLIFMLPVVWDGITDPVMGWIASRTRTRIGRYRPYILFGTPIMAVSFVLMFAAPVLLPSAVVVASAASHVLFRTAYTVVSIPYTSLSAAMTRNGDERSSIAGMRMFAALFGGLFTAAFTLELAKTLGEGNLANGFVGVSILFAVLATVILIVVFLATKEAPLSPRIEEEFLSTAETLRFLKSNSAFWILFAAVFLGAVGSSVSGKALVYYVAYFAERPDAVSQVLTSVLLVTGLSVPFWSLIAQKVSKRTIWVTAALGAAACQATLLILAPTSIAVLICILCFGGFFGGAFVTMFWAMLPDTVEFGEWHSGVRDEAILFGINQFALKAASGLGVGVLGIALGAIGYIAGQAQTEESLQGLRVLSFGIPLVTGLAAAAIISFYPISRELHERLSRAISFKEKRAR